MKNSLYTDALGLLKQLISTPSFSREEDKTAGILEDFFKDKNIPFQRLKNNIWAYNKHFNPVLPTI